VTAATCLLVGFLAKRVKPSNWRWHRTKHQRIESRNYHDVIMSASCGPRAEGQTLTIIDHIPDLPDDYLAEIGRITVRWSVVESLVHICLIRFSGGDPSEGRWLVLFTHMSAQQKIDALGALLEELNVSLPLIGSEMHRAALCLIREAQSQRNAVTHATWEYANGTATMGRYSARGKLKILGKPTTVGELREISELIFRAGDALQELSVAVLRNTSPQSGQ
jgi:hypothetical protein